MLRFIKEANQMAFSNIQIFPSVKGNKLVTYIKGNYGVVNRWQNIGNLEDAKQHNFETEQFNKLLWKDCLQFSEERENTR